MLERNDIILTYKKQISFKKSASFSRNSHKKIHDFTYSSYEGLVIHNFVMSK